MRPFRDENVKVALRANVGGKAENSGKTLRFASHAATRGWFAKCFIARGKDPGKSM
jgi:hypothetical protein